MAIEDRDPGDEGHAVPAPVPSLVPQPHGGALLTGGKPGNKGGGRKPNELRRKARGNLDLVLKEIRKRLTKAEKISDRDLARYGAVMAEYGVGKRNTTKLTGSGPNGSIPVSVVGPIVSADD